MYSARPEASTNRLVIVLLLAVGCDGSTPSPSGGSYGPPAYDGFAAVDGAPIGPGTRTSSSVAQPLSYTMTDAGPAAAVLAGWVTNYDGYAQYLVFEVRNDVDRPLCSTSLSLSVRNASDAVLDSDYVFVHSSLADVSYAGWDDCLAAGQTAFAIYYLHWSFAAVDHVVIENVFGVPTDVPAPPANVVGTAYEGGCTGASCTIHVTALNNGTASAVVSGGLAGTVLLVDDAGTPLAVGGLGTLDYLDVVLDPGGETTLQSSFSFDSSTTHILVHIDFDLPV